MNIQFKKGVLELLVLSLLSKKDFYGYELVSTISGQIHISEGTIYPLLKRLKEQGYFKTYLEESTGGPSRKYYTLTELGKREKESLEAEWDDFAARVNNIIKGDNDHE